jgi:hypothetical protein
LSERFFGNEPYHAAVALVWLRAGYDYLLRMDHFQSLGRYCPEIAITIHQQRF